MVVVAMQYRLNIFAFGDGKSAKNLALKDQRLAIEWVRKHIAGFGGDPENVTVAGESAGAVYAHAHVVLNAPVKQAILMSGTLDMSPPRPLAHEATIVGPIEAKLASVGSSLRTASATEIIKALTELNIVSMWLQQDPNEPELNDWTRPGLVQGLLIGDVEYESILWRNGIEALAPQMISDSFNLAGERSGELRRAYSISGSRATPTKTGALDFINDVRFSWPIRKLSKAWRASGLPVYGYVVDQTNPWQGSSRAHHAVDLLLLFGGLDLSFNPPAAAVGEEMRRRWIAFVNGEAPWPANTTFALGPHGKCAELNDSGLAARRRLLQMETLERVEPAKIAAVFAALAAGRVSILN
ncbi:carboxylesterase [Botryosphaeria dothidea]|uniref:Carboxylic ester hydrolase n=1 Tax=Botryosphaeria dothidea TaxID=55169 RepID=A0A8H4ITK3_9PEZI|nr:carboxylesterase [Botryosphaeria dothidea]